MVLVLICMISLVKTFTSKSAIISLISMEFMSASVFCFMAVWMGVPTSMVFCVSIICFIVCDGVLGLGIISSMHGSGPFGPHGVSTANFSG